MKPILFNTEMVRAILEGRKTVTRRVIKGQDKNTMYAGRCALGVGLFDNNTSERVIEPPYRVGDILYVRETWYRGLNRILYKANYADNEKFYQDGKEILIKWKPSIHMPKEAARLFLRVTGVRVERLQDINNPEAEGIEVYPILNDPEGTYYKRLFAFMELWDSTIKKDQLNQYSWNANPYVWVIEFENISEDIKNGRV